MYELLIKLEKDLEYKKFKIKDLKEIKAILEQYNWKTKEVKLEKVEGKGLNAKRS